MPSSSSQEKYSTIATRATACLELKQFRMVRTKTGGGFPNRSNKNASSELQNCAKLLKTFRGEVAEWLKASVC